MNRMIRLLDSTVGQKTVTALTGIALLGFLVAHMLGNLQLFAGQDAINSYAAKLQGLGVLLWIARAGLLGLLVLHIVMTVRLKIRNRHASGGRYAKSEYRASTGSSRNMIITGSVIAAFIIFHLAHFTFGVIQPESHDLVDPNGRHDVYSMVVAGFQNWLIVGIYIAGLLMITSHVSHAAFSVFQSLGINVGGIETPMKRVAKATAVALVAGYVVIPLAVAFGFLG